MICIYTTDSFGNGINCTSGTEIVANGTSYFVTEEGCLSESTPISETIEEYQNNLPPDSYDNFNLNGGTGSVLYTLAFVPYAFSGMNAIYDIGIGLSEIY